MHKQNNGQSADDILQNQFTAYLVTAVKRHKILYTRKKAQRQQTQAPLELHDFELQIDTDLLTGLVLLDQIENPMLYLALQQARDRERYIFLTRILEERS